MIGGRERVLGGLSWAICILHSKAALDCDAAYAVAFMVAFYCLRLTLAD